jgi:hypothetical protein
MSVKLSSSDCATATKSGATLPEGVGIAARTAAIYAQFNIPTLPLGADKNPLVSGFKINRLTMRQSRAYMARYPTADVLGVPDGPLSGVVRLDIDEHGDHVTEEVLRRAGQPGAIARTASGKHHLWYSDNGERRLTGSAGHRNARPWDDLKVDLCGQGGYAISPPSRFADGRVYQFQGDINLEELLRNRHRLPKIRGLPDRAYVVPEKVPPGDADDLRLAKVGERDSRFWPYIARYAQHAKSLEVLIEHAREWNDLMDPPLSNAEVDTKCRYWWELTQKGENRYGIGKHILINHSVIDDLLMADPDAFALLTILRRHHWGREFVVANEMKILMPKGGWGRPRLSAARSKLINLGFLIVVRPASRTPPLPMLCRFS